ncbi:T9SS type A sorting domain-containing protein [Polaribacter sp. MSW13]|uniref:T9SS type A sorting domain-containing protein n=1 Tax=Polaribacter marinus TaxID=2916838 RepID=A0A9X2AKV7_9FLAO|nr:T9SS type A sorting domain-containing protein [Polaribacter marinus]MCI2228630.1 T9SS type A sorting domain-containing protein [Polaribacter marinus]
MKKNYLFTLLLTLCFSTISLGQEMLLNGGFENWDNNTTPTDWSKVENTTKESTEKRTGDFSAKIVGGTSDLAQTISGIVAGDSYTITLWYKVESGDDTDARIWSYWRDASNSNIDNNDNDSEDAIRGPNNDYLDNNGNIWTKYETTITAPAGATQFYFELRVYGSAVVYWDDLSFMHNVVGTDPVISILSPSDNTVFPSTTTEVQVQLSIANFTLSGDNGSEMSDSTGDGYILGTLEEVGEAPGSKNIFTTTPEAINVDPGKSYNLTVELVDNAGTSLSPKVETTISFSVDLPCDLQLGAIDTTCDATTSGVDTYSGSIAFTGGANGYTYTVTAPGGVTVGGDDPSSVASGTITFTGMTEGVDTDITIVGDATSSCNLLRTLYSPTCVPTAACPGEGAIIITEIMQNPFSVTDDNGEYFEVYNTTGAPIDMQGWVIGTASTGAPATDVIASSVVVPANGYVVFGENADFSTNGSVNVDYQYNSSLFLGNGTATITLSCGASVIDEVTYDNGATFPDPKGKSMELAASKYNATDNDFGSNWGEATAEITSGGDLGTPGAANSFTLSIGRNDIEGFTTYPNPITNHTFTVATSTSDKKEVVIFNVLGKKVFSATFTGLKKDLDVSTINSGIYILKVTENGKTATKKLVIR